MKRETDKNAKKWPEYQYLTDPVAPPPKPLVDRQVLLLYAEGNKAFDPKADVRASAQTPGLEVFLPPPDRSTGMAVVLIPGGSYHHITASKIFTVAESLRGRGATVYVLFYRYGTANPTPAPLDDGTRAVRIVRAHAADWKLDPKHVTVIGLSAGGHLAGWLAAAGPAGAADAADPIDRVSAKPDLAALISPVVSMREDWSGTRGNTMPPGADTAAFGKTYSIDLLADRTTPPTFLWHAADDKAVSADGNSGRLAAALKVAGVDHLYVRPETGGHVGGWNETWGKPLLAWLEAKGVLRPIAATPAVSNPAEVADTAPATATPAAPAAPPSAVPPAPAGVASAGGIVPMPLVPWDKESEAVRVTADGVAVPVGEWIAAGKEPQVRYCHFDTGKPVTVTVTFPKPPPKEQPLPIASNDRARIVPESTGADRKTWRFTMHPNTKVYLKLHRTFICASAPDPDAPKPNDPGVIDVAGRGAKADGSASVTMVIQGAIDEASKGAGKKIVYLPAGVYMSGTLFMRDGVTLYLAPGAVLRGSEDPAQWRHRAGAFYDGTSAFIFFGNDVEQDGKTVGVRDAAVRGRGVIDGHGAFFRPAVIDGKPGNNPYFYEGDKTQKARLVFAMLAQNCRVEGVTLRNPVFWTTHVLASKKFDFTDVKVYANYRINNDGLNYDGCTDSTIDNCVMITGDDSHCLKNEYINGLGGPNERIRMANSITAGFGMGIKFGWAFHQAHDCTYENNWLAGGSFGIHVGRKPIRVTGPKIAEVTGLTLRNMVIEGNLSVDAVGNAIEGYKLSDIRIENTRVDGKFDVKNTTGLRITALTVAGKPIANAEDLAGVKNCTDVVVRER